MRFICTFAIILISTAPLTADTNVNEESEENNEEILHGSSRLLLQNERRGRRRGGVGIGAAVAPVAAGNVVVAPIAGNRALARARGRGFVQPFNRRRFNRFNNVNAFVQPFNRFDTVFGIDEQCALIGCRRVGAACCLDRFQRVSCCNVGPYGFETGVGLDVDIGTANSLVVVNPNNDGLATEIGNDIQCRRHRDCDVGYVCRRSVNCDINAAVQCPKYCVLNTF